MLVGSDAIATTILIIPCDKQPIYQMHVKPVLDNKPVILFGYFDTQHAYARKCICNETPCKGIITEDIEDDEFNALVPLGNTYEIHKQKVQKAKEYIKHYGDADIAVQALQDYYSK